MTEEELLAQIENPVSMWPIKFSVDKTTEVLKAALELEKCVGKKLFYRAGDATNPTAFNLRAASELGTEKESDVNEIFLETS